MKQGVCIKLRTLHKYLVAASHKTQLIKSMSKEIWAISKNEKAVIFNRLSMSMSKGYGPYPVLYNIRFQTMCKCLLI